MNLRIGRVTNIDTSTGKVRVNYEDADNATLWLYMLTFNNEVSMPNVGDMVVTLHMENGSSKGFVLGTFYGGSKKPKARSGYRKDYPGGAYTTSDHDEVTVSAQTVNLAASDIRLGAHTVDEIISRIEALESRM